MYVTVGACALHTSLIVRDGVGLLISDVINVHVRTTAVLPSVLAN